jgi:hypothetical protein
MGTSDRPCGQGTGTTILRRYDTTEYDTTEYDTTEYDTTEYDSSVAYMPRVV